MEQSSLRQYILSRCFTKGHHLWEKEAATNPQIPRSRSCSEAGILPHWCTCLKWKNVSSDDPLYQRAGQALVDHINSLTQSVRSKCRLRTLTCIEWVMKQQPNSQMLSFQSKADQDGYFSLFGKSVKITSENYQVKIEVGPAEARFEASMVYMKKEDKFHIDTREISRTNAYNDDPHCITANHPHLNMFCYCRYLKNMFNMNK